MDDQRDGAGSNGDVERLGTHHPLTTAPPGEAAEFLVHLAGGAGLHLSESASEAFVRSASGHHSFSAYVSRMAVDLGAEFVPLPVELDEMIALVRPSRPVLLLLRRGDELTLCAIIDGGREPSIAVEMLSASGLRSLRALPGHVASTARLDAFEVLAAYHVGAAETELEELESTGLPERPLRRLWYLVAPDRAEILIVAWAALGLGILTLSTPIAVQSLVNFVAFGGLMQPLIVVGLLLFFFMSFAGAVRVFKLYVVEILQRRVLVRVVSDLAVRLPRVPIRKWEEGFGPELVNRYFDVMTVQKAGSRFLISGLDAVLQSAIGLLVLGFYHPLLLLFDIVLVLSIAFIVFGLGRGGFASARKESKAKYEIAAALEDIARLPVTYKILGGPEFARARLSDLTSQYIGHRRKHYGVVMRQIIGTVALHAIAGTALLTLGGFLVIQGQLTLGQLVAAELIVSLALVSFVKFGKEFETFYDLLAGVDKLGLLFDLPLEADGGEPYPLGRSGAGLELRDVEVRSCRASGSRMSIRIQPNEKIVFRGPRGSGKSTLADLVSALRSPEAGIVLIDGLDTREIRRDSIRANVGLVKETEIVAASVADNVRLGRSELSTREISESLEQLGILDEILALPNGLQTELASNGAPLSETTGQLLVIARSVVDRPRLLVIDGVLDDLDRSSVRRVMSVIAAANAPWTLIVFSSRDDIDELIDADRVVDLGGQDPGIRGAVSPLLTRD